MMINFKMPKRFIPIVLVIALAAGFAGGFYFRGYKDFDNGSVLSTLINRSPASNEVDFNQFWTVWDLMHSHFVDRDKLDTQNLVYGAIEGMVKAAGDPYTVFFRPKESEEFRQQINGSFGGIGIEIGLRKDVLTVIAPIKDTPAAKAGLLAGDKILKVGEKSTEGMKIDEAVSLIRGPKGTEVKITIMRDGWEKPQEFSLERAIIKVPALEWRMLDDGTTAYIQMFVFNKNVDDEFKDTANEIIKSKATKIILDLRNNPGGLLDSAVNIAGYFLDADKIVTIEKFGDGKTNEFKTQANAILKNYPLIIIINKGSASASEILSGSLKDNLGVTLVGETSFGKGSVQEVNDLAKKASVKITIAKWLTPNGTSINENGIKPDVEVKLTDEDARSGKDPQLDKAKELIKNLR